MVVPAAMSVPSITTTWETRAFAKINLHLEVLGRRADGFHELRTVFQTIGLADTLTVEFWDGPLALACPDSEVPADGTNLVTRAALTLAAVLGRRADGVRLTLHKRIPTQAGLGGGSADAMAALRLLAHVWQAPVDRALLVEMGSRLGSDVAFFAEGGTTIGTGRGEVLTPLADLPPQLVVVARPSFGVSTRDAYAWVAADRASGVALAGRRAHPFWPSMTDEWATTLAGCWNDFEPVVSGRHPVLAAVIQALRSAGAGHALLSGSGSAVAAIFGDRAAAMEGAAVVGRRPGWQTWVVPTVDRASYTRETAPRPGPDRGAVGDLDRGPGRDAEGGAEGDTEPDHGR